MQNKSKIPAFLINTMIVLYFLYMHLFNYLSDELRIKFAGIILVSQAVSTVFSLVFKMSRYGFLLLSILFFITLLSTLYPIIFQTHGEYDYASIARVMLSLFFAIHVACFPDRINNKLLLFLAYGTLVFGAFWVVANPSIIFVGSERLAVFTGGGNAVQASSSVLTLCLIISHQLFVKKEIKPAFFYPILISSIVIIYLYKVSAVYLLVGFYFGGFLFLKTKNITYRALMVLAGIVFIGTVLVHHEMRDNHSITNLATLGNGRIMAYIERFDMLTNSDITSLIFGAGPGSDITNSYTWSAMIAGHSDFLAILTEYGIVGLILFSFFFGIIIKRVNYKHAIPLFCGLFASSFITVGFIYRPATFPFFWMAVGIAMQQTMRAKKITENPVNSIAER